MLEYNWEEGFSYLEAFVQRKGHARPLRSYKTANEFALGAWVSVQRRSRSKMTPDREARLESLSGWVWNKYEYQWDEGFSYLEAFVQKKGHAKPSARYKTVNGFTLGYWVNNQRKLRNEMTPERRARLESLSGWVWNKYEFQWEEGFAHLQAFVEKVGHARVPYIFNTDEGYTLGKWVSTQRMLRNKMIPERIAKLESLSGWVWDLLEYNWEEGFSYLEAFVQGKGHARPPRIYKTGNRFTLGAWVSVQRRSRPKMTPERKARLESLSGWVWKATR